jgi:spermidine synthase
MSIDSRPLALVLAVSSGCAALGYQIVWTQQAALWLGHESAAVLAVVAAFFGGLALGALLLGPKAHTTTAPARWFAACEAVIGVWGLVLAFSIEPVTRALLAAIGPEPSPAWHWLVAFCGTFVLLLPATAAMGVTLPAMERAIAQRGASRASIATLYAGNTAGAVLGVLAAALWLVPNIGLTATAWTCAVLNFVAAAIALLAFEDAPAATRPAAAAPATRRAARAWPLLAVTGLLGIGYEVLVVRVLSQVTENTVYTFALLLAVYLVGTALGAALYGRVLVQRDTDGALRDRLLRSLAAACLLSVLGLAVAEPIRAEVLRTLGGGFRAAVAAEAALAVLGFLLPTVAMGALFSHLATMAGVTLGRVLGVNTLGAAAAPWLFGVVLLPTVGAKPALLGVAAAYLALTSARAWRAPAHWIAVGATAASAVWMPTPTRVDLPPHGRVVMIAEGPLATVSILADANGIDTLHINNRQQEGSTATVPADARQALLPMLLHPAPHRALFLGLGTGVTASAAAQDRELEVEAVELLPEVIAASDHFRRAVFGSAPQPRLRLIAADARRFVRTTPMKYDLVVADNFHPARSGSGSLYTIEHFRAIRLRLADGGLFCQWLPLHQLDLDTLRSIVRSFIATYPNGAALLATNSLDTPVVGLIGRPDAARFDLEAIRSRLATAALPRRPADFGLTDDLAVLGTFIAGPRALARFAGAVPLNTDDKPVVAYRAPRITYARASEPRDRLLALLREVDVHPDDILAAHDATTGRRLAAYWTARDRFLEAGRDVRATSNVTAMLAQVREPLLGVLRISPDFRPAYDPLLRMASDLERSDLESARALLTELEKLQPARPEAAQALLKIGDR